jgi:hypothetical protein
MHQKVTPNAIPQAINGALAKGETQKNFFSYQRNTFKSSKLHMHDYCGQVVDNFKLST